MKDLLHEDGTHKTKYFSCRPTLCEPNNGEYQQVVEELH